MGSYESPWKGLKYTSLDSEIKLAEPNWQDFIKMIGSLNELDLEKIKIERSEVGQNKKLGNYLNRIAYHESVHTG